jgi:TPR repeat protein
MYANGGVPQDDAEAVRWYRLAADQGFANAQYELGIKYDEGQGVPQDDVQAHMWFNLAASRMTGEARENAVQGRDVAAALLTLDSLNEAQRLAREWDAAHPREPSALELYALLASGRIGVPTERAPRVASGRRGIRWSPRRPHG